MPSRVCQHCGLLVFERRDKRRFRPGIDPIKPPWNSHRPCQKQADSSRDRRRLTTTERGYDGNHERAAKAIRESGAGCVLCGVAPGDPSNPITAGHIVALADGGSNELSNYQPECRRCNSAKSGRRRK